MKLKKSKRKISTTSLTFNPIVVLAVAVVFATLGLYLIQASRAATPVVAMEAELGTVAAPSVKVADTAASAGSAVKFGTATTPKTPVKVMPLGDSLTEGYTVTGGYRILLWQKLVQTDKDNIDFVGSQSSGPASLVDKNHEGHSGWCMDGGCYSPGTAITPVVDGWLNTYKPDIILLQIGTNDLFAGATTAQMESRLDVLLGKIYTDLPNVKVIVAKLIPTADGGLGSERLAYASSIIKLATKYQSQGRTIQTVDMAAVVSTSSDYADNVHLNQAGYDKMANAWYPLVTNYYKQF